MQATYLWCLFVVVAVGVVDYVDVGEASERAAAQQFILFIVINLKHVSIF